MERVKIGVFDSGIGGIPVMVKLKKEFPFVDFIYFGDNGNVPYGSRESKEICELTLRGVNELINAGANAVVLACNTASLNWRGEITGVKVFRLIPHIPETFRGEVGYFLGTPSTVSALRASGAFSAFEHIRYFPLPYLAAAVEKSVFSDKELVLADHLMTTEQNPAFVYLGCTHYLYYEGEIKRFFRCEKTFDGTDDLIKNIRENKEFSAREICCKPSVSFVGAYAEKNSLAFSQYMKKWS